MIRIVIFCLISLMTFSSFGYDDPFVELLKKTSSVYSGVMTIDDDNAGEVLIETTLTGQKVYLTFSSKKLDTTAYTLINNNPAALAKSGKKSLDPPIILLGETQILVNNLYAPTPTCDGSDVQPNDVSCAGRKCNIVQRVISQCNADNCWSFDDNEELPWDDRLLLTTKLGSLRLDNKIDISDCLPNNVEGAKYRIKFSTAGSGPASKAGGTIQYNIVLKNDTAETRRK